MLFHGAMDEITLPRESSAHVKHSLHIHLVPPHQPMNQPRLPRRTTKTAEKGLTLDTNHEEYAEYLPGGNESAQSFADGEMGPFTTFNQFRSDHHLLTSKVNRQYLPRVTAYYTAA